MYMQNKIRLIDKENLWLPKGKRKGEGQIKGVRLTNTNYYV